MAAPVTLADLHSQTAAYARNAVIIRRYTWVYNNVSAADVVLGTASATLGHDDNEEGVAAEYVGADITVELLPFLATQYPNPPTALATPQNWIDWLKTIAGTRLLLRHMLVQGQITTNMTLEGGGISLEITDIPSNPAALGIAAYAGLF